MCKGIIGHCQCLRCIDHPAPGKLKRVDFCEKKQDELVGVTSSLATAECRFQLAPCKDLTLVRMREPDACHFRSEGAKEETMDTFDSLAIRFTPINAASIARAALSVLGENITDFSGQGAAVVASDGSNKMDVNGPPRDAAQHKVNSTKLIETQKPDSINHLEMTGNMDINNLSSTDNGHSAEPPKGDKKSTATDPLPIFETTQEPTNTPTEADIETNTDNGSRTGARTPNNDMPKTPKGRTPLPTSRPSQILTPLVPPPITAAAAAVVVAAPSQTAESVAKDAWTHQETVKLLLLRCKEIDFAEMAKFLPGRDAAACMDRLARVAVNHGYEAYI
ncbi:hypothetical protein C7999DRAFT_12444 [Corynascus novoguineensis]|uniref:Uncharacterized protein n=1 Tax=Corynascus novoguineensis TaxID=1126955 RepID=A0AAN7HRW6_9PEZI|nr:hypothetical protein C7999DRAFT_12444 [Corynascus novoguineensis]